MIPFSLDGKNILITGASSGIGRSCAIECSKMGANLILIGRNQERLKEVELEIERNLKVNKQSCISISVDLVDKIGEGKDIIEEAVSKVGKLSGFVHSAGIEKTIPIKAMKPEHYRELFEINFLSGFELARNIIKKKFSNDNTSIVFISSITSLIGRPALVGYSATKGAINAGVRSMAIELAARGIRVNSILPGTVMTPMISSFFDKLSEEERNKRINGYPLGLGKPEDVAYAVIYLLSDASRWMTAQEIVVDGGYTAK